MAESKVTIKAVLEDRLSVPIKKAKKSVEELTTSVEKHGKTADKSFSKASKSAEDATTKTVRSGAKLEKALDAVGTSAIGMGTDFGRAENKVSQALGGMTSEAKTASSRIDRALSTAGVRGGDSMVANLKTAGVKFVDRARTIGKEAAANIEDALSNIQMPTGAGIAGGAGTIGGVVASLQRDSTSRATAAASGSDPKAMRKLIDEAYRDNFGEDYNSVALSADSIIGTFDIEPGSPEAERLLRGNLTLEKVFGLDPKMLSFGVELFMKTDNLTAQQAQDVMGGILQRAAPAARDELLDNINEYMPLLSGTGMSSVGLGTFMADASQIGGQYGSDKTGDLAKEWEIIARDPSKDQKAAYNELGLDQAQIVGLMNEGRGDEAFQMTAEAIKNADPADQGRLAVGVYGTPAEDLGLSNIDEYAEMWSKATTEASAYKGVMDGMMGNLAEGEGAAFGRMIRAAGESIVAIGDEIAPKLTPFFEGLTKLAPLVGPLLALFTGMSILKYGKKALDLAAGLAGIDKKGRKATGAMGGLRGAMVGHPVLTAATGIYLAGEAMGYLYDESELVRNAMNGIADALERIEANKASYANAVDDWSSGKLGLENKGGYEEAKEMQNMDIRPDWWKDAMRPVEEGLGWGPQSKKGEGWLRWMPWLQEQPADEAHADGGWTSGNAYRAGERGREFVVHSTSASSISRSNPGAFEYMNKTGQLPSSGESLIANITINGATDPGAVAVAVRQELAKARKASQRDYSDRSTRGAK